MDDDVVLGSGINILYKWGSRPVENSDQRYNRQDNNGHRLVT